MGADGAAWQESEVDDEVAVATVVEGRLLEEPIAETLESELLSKL
jgi:hypothetical protein